MDELYRLIGMVMRNAQAIEKNLSAIIYFDRILSVFDNGEKVTEDVFFSNHENADDLFDWMSDVPMGEIVKLARKTPSLSKKLVADLERVMKYRNYVAHKIFKGEMFLVGGKITQRDLTSLKNRAINELGFSSKLNNTLLIISDDLRKEYDGITECH